MYMHGILVPNVTHHRNMKLNVFTYFIMLCPADHGHCQEERERNFKILKGIII